MRRLLIRLLLSVLLLTIGQSVVADARSPLQSPTTSQSATIRSVATNISGIPDLVQSYLEEVRARLVFLAHSAPRVPQELSMAAGHLSEAASETGVRTVLAWLVLVVIGGITAEALFWQATRGRRRRIAAARLDMGRERVAIVLMRVGYELLRLLMFAAGSLGAFLLFDWPPPIGALLLDCLLAVVFVRFALVLSRFALAPDSERFRLLPMTTRAARFWHLSFAAVTAIAAFGWATTALVTRLGVSEPARLLTAYAFGGLLIAAAIWTTWSGRRFVMMPPRAVAEESAKSHAAALLPILATILFPLIGLLFLTGAHQPAWFLIVASTLPAAAFVTKRAIANLLRPRNPASNETPAYAVVVERGARTVLIVVAALVLARAWDLDVATLATGDSFATRLLRGALDGIVIFLIADLLWQLVKLAIDRKLSSTENAGAVEAASEEEIRRRARIRTLLPILRNILLVVLTALAMLMALSAMGIQIGPLLAGAGVIGVAVGFGAQTLVKDIFAGVFFLLDDAFRVGEYIVSGNIKGTVESFSLRSVKLRHHRGPLHTVPFGDMKEITNYSRDWVIDKIQVGVTYDTDLDKVKTVVKQVSAEIMQDPELAAVILEPLKSQGVYQMGDFAIQIRLKVKTKPNEQFIVRRAIYAKIKKAFDANGIKFAVPTVAVAGSGDASLAPAGARQVLELSRSKSAAP